ncbi:MAG TPA: maleylpyruvate isomerase family mycothiol-dependent enzyme [Acidimicrobiales bacterium]|nr:maleylpyruvate isomerase family mycothiol-dependent enzyme [Acidimicrobiales bacterium]
MEVDAYVAALDREGHLLVDAARRAGTTSPVPTCPGWGQPDLLAHIGFVHRWATRYVATAISEMADEPDEAAILACAPGEGGRVAWVAEGHAALVRALRAAPADLECWTFLAAPCPLAFWARRQAHETAVHRVDAELAAGLVPTPVDPELAADGIDELLFGFFARPPRRTFEIPGGAVTLALETVDRPERWVVRVSDLGVEARRGPGQCDLAVRGSASDLYLLLWHRRSPRGVEGLETESLRVLFEQVWGPRGVTWA